MNEKSPTSPTGSGKPSATRPGSPRRRRSSWTQRIAGLALTTTLILSGSGCCSLPSSLEAPRLPPGEPSRVIAERISKDLLRHHPLPTPGSPPPTEITIPRQLLVRIFAHLDAWRAWAKALEAAGQWAETE